MEEYSKKDGFKGAGFDKLSKDIQRASFFSGFNIIKNGKYPATHHGLLDCQGFSCCQGLKYRVCHRNGKKSNNLPSIERKIKYHQNRLNNRGEEGGNIKAIIHKQTNIRRI